jgi:signal transduction histidine kinase
LKPTPFKCGNYFKIGLNEKFADQIFIPLEKLHGISAYEGTGIGLTICKKNYISPWRIYLCDKSGGARVYLHLA